MVVECLCHDSDEHVENNDLAHKHATKPDEVDEDVLNVDVLLFTIREVAIATAQMGRTEVTHHE